MKITAAVGAAVDLYSKIPFPFTAGCQSTLEAFSSFERAGALVAAMPWDGVDPPTLSEIRFTVTPNDRPFIHRNEYVFSVDNQAGEASHDPCEAFALALVLHCNRQLVSAAKVADTQLWVETARQLLGHYGSPTDVGVELKHQENVIHAALSTPKLVGSLPERGDRPIEPRATCFLCHATLSTDPDKRWMNAWADAAFCSQEHAERHADGCQKRAEQCRCGRVILRGDFALRELAGWLCGACIPADKIASAELAGERPLSPIEKALAPLAKIHLLEGAQAATRRAEAMMAAAQSLKQEATAMLTHGAIPQYEAAAKRYGEAMKRRRFRLEIKNPDARDPDPEVSAVYLFDLPDRGPHYLAVMRADATVQEGRNLLAWQKVLPPSCRMIVTPAGTELDIVELVAVDPLPADAVRRFPGVVETITCGRCGLTADENWVGWWAVAQVGCDHLCAHCYATERPQDYMKGPG